MSTPSPSSLHFAYLHGFASGPLSYKGVTLAQRFEAGGDAILHRPDLNSPSFAEMTFGRQLEVVDAMDAEIDPDGAKKWCLLGSSMGGYLAARWAELHPERVASLVLLCPGFDILRRWEQWLGEEELLRWKEQGTRLFEDGAGQPQPLHYELVAEALEHPACPQFRCPATIIHGLQDEVIPIEQSRQYAATREHVTLVEVEGDHSLATQIDRIAEELARRGGLSRL